MRGIISVIFFFGILGNFSAQNKHMKQEILKKIELNNFNNRIGLEMGLTILNLAKERKQKVREKEKES